MLADKSLGLLLLDAHTHYAFQPMPVAPDLLRRLYELVRMGPTAMNSQPVRLLFVTTPAAKQRLLPALAPGNVDKARSAPVTAIIAFDTAFHTKLPVLAPHLPDAQERVGGMTETAREGMARLSATLQAGYLILTARGLGLDCGPMAGFDAAKVDAEFFPDGAWKSFLLLNLGHGDPARRHPRAPRLAFDEACQIL